MSFYSGKFEVYFNKMKKLDIASFFVENISFHEFLQLKVISFLSSNQDSDSVQVSQLVENSGVSPQAISKLLKSIEEKNYIVRFSNKSDRRITEVKLTDEGTRVYEVTNRQFEEVMDRVFSNFTDEEIKNFAFLAEKFLNLYADTVDKMKMEENTL